MTTTKSVERRYVGGPYNGNSFTLSADSDYHVIPSPTGQRHVYILGTKGDFRYDHTESPLFVDENVPAIGDTEIGVKSIKSSKTAEEVE